MTPTEQFDARVRSSESTFHDPERRSNALAAIALVGRLKGVERMQIRLGEDATTFDVRFAYGDGPLLWDRWRRVTVTRSPDQHENEDG